MNPVEDDDLDVFDNFQQARVTALTIVHDLFPQAEPGLSAYGLARWITGEDGGT